MIDEQIKIKKEFLKMQQEIINYFDSLNFYEEIKKMDLKIKIKTEQTDFKLKIENDLNDFYNEKVKKKMKEWEDKVQAAKWKSPVQVYGKMECKNGHSLSDDPVICGDCQKDYLYWVDPKEGYVICKTCNHARKIRKIVCGKCNADILAELKIPE